MRYILKNFEKNLHCMLSKKKTSQDPQVSDLNLSNFCLRTIVCLIKVRGTRFQSEKLKSFGRTKCISKLSVC